MSRSEIIRSLANNVRAYKGLHYNPPNTPTDKINWVRTPQKSKADRIKELLGKLGLDEAQQAFNLEKIDAFKHVDDFQNWIKKFQSPPTTK